MKKIVIIGGGFAGLSAAKRLRKKKKLSVTVIDKNKYHTYTPAIAKLAAYKISQDECLIQLSPILSKMGIRFLNAEVKGIDVKNKVVRTDKKNVPYDYLIKSVGSVTNFFNVAGAKKNSLVLKTAVDAINIRNHIENLFQEEKANRNIVVVGGGPTGVEIAADIIDYAHDLCKIYNLDKEKTSVYIVDRAKHLLNSQKKMSKVAEHLLRKKGIIIYTGRTITRIKPNEIMFKDNRKIQSETVIWVGGIKPHILVGEQEARVCREKNLISDIYLQSASKKPIFEAGDAVVCYDERLHGQIVHNAPAAINQGKLAAENIIRLINGKKLKKLCLRKYPVIITLGNSTAIFSYKNIILHGRWVTWLKNLIRKHYLFSLRYL